MILIWKGRGILVPVILALSMFIGAIIQDKLNVNNWFYGVSIILAGIVFLLIAPRTEEYKDGSVLKSSEIASFWFMGLKVWSIIAFIVGMYMIIKDLFI